MLSSGPLGNSGKTIGCPAAHTRVQVNCLKKDFDQMQMCSGAKIGIGLCHISLTDGRYLSYHRYDPFLIIFPTQPSGDATLQGKGFSGCCLAFQVYRQLLSFCQISFADQ